SSRRRHTRFSRDWSSDVCSSDLVSTKDLRAATVVCFSPVGCCNGTVDARCVEFIIIGVVVRGVDLIDEDVRRIVCFCLLEEIVSADQYAVAHIAEPEVADKILLCIDGFSHIILVGGKAVD